MQPWHADAVADTKPLHICAGLFHHAHNLVTGYDRQFAGNLALDSMQIGVAQRRTHEPAPALRHRRALGWEDQPLQAVTAPPGRDGEEACAFIRITPRGHDLRRVSLPSDQQHGHVGFAQDMRGRGAENELTDARVTVGAHHDQVGANGFFQLENLNFRIAVKRFRLGGDAGFERLLLRLVQGSRKRRLRRRERRPS